MVKRKIYKSIDRSKYKDYFLVADNFYRGAELAKEFEYWNVAGLLIVHSAIAYSDSLAIKYGGVKSTSDDHCECVSLIESIIERDEKSKNAIQNFRRILDRKSEVSYGGEIYYRKDIEQMWKWFERFRNWCLKIL